MNSISRVERIISSGLLAAFMIWLSRNNMDVTRLAIIGGGIFILGVTKTGTRAFWICLTLVVLSVLAMHFGWFGLRDARSVC